jgi:hypothetical protein
LFTQSIISNRIGYLDKLDFEYLKNECQEILAMPTNLLFSALQHPNFNPKWISFVISKNLIANELNFNHLI